MTALFAATFVFVLTHFVTSTRLRAVLVKALGEWPYRAVYSLVALAALAWMAGSYGTAPDVPLWKGVRYVPVVVLPFAFALLACGYWRNPTMVGADKLLKSTEPARGVIRITRHPIMWAVMLWAAAHVAARGDLKSLIFFGGLLLVAGGGTLAIDARKKSHPDWARFAAVTSNLPFAAIAAGRNRLIWREIGWTRPAIGLAVFAALLLGHASLFGARPY